MGLKDTWVMFCYALRDVPQVSGPESCKGMSKEWKSFFLSWSNVCLYPGFKRNEKWWMWERNATTFCWLASFCKPKLQENSKGMKVSAAWRIALCTSHRPDAQKEPKDSGSSALKRILSTAVPPSEGKCGFVSASFEMIQRGASVSKA